MIIVTMLGKLEVIINLFEKFKNLFGIGRKKDVDLIPQSVKIGCDLKKMRPRFLLNVVNNVSKDIEICGIGFIKAKGREKCYTPFFQLP
ncbi:MAG: hypothetical protein KAS87_01960 [Candidatus Omnitrophica bacterium]|nr:hypothetical protein [Candidatus Omnitrophota bacterium]